MGQGKAKESIDAPSLLSVVKSPTPDGREKRPQMEALFPEKIWATGWQRSSGVRIFNESNLFKHINGAAEAFFAYGFELCGTAEYVSDSDTGEASASSEDEFILVDIYDMGRPIQAFGMYTSELYPELEIVDIGAQGYIETPTLNFWKGPYYVKIAATSVEEGAGKANIELAKYIAQKIPGKAEDPPMLSLLPHEGLVSGTENYTLSNILGYSFLENGVMADYQVGNEEKSLLIMECESVDAAKEVFAQFVSYEGESGEGLAKIADLGEAGFIVGDKYYKRLIAVRQGRYVIMTRAVTDEPVARKLIETAIDNIIGQKSGV